MSNEPLCKACKQPMYVGLGTQPPVCDNRTCVRYVPSLSERKAGTTFPRPIDPEYEIVIDPPVLDWAHAHLRGIDWGSEPLFLSEGARYHTLCGIRFRLLTDREYLRCCAGDPPLWVADAARSEMRAYELDLARSNPDLPLVLIDGVWKERVRDLALDPDRDPS